jgi:putative nucleotidyltransferase with HDIG domain
MDGAAAVVPALPMLKKISVEQLRPGMFIQDLDCGWMDHPFLRNRFAVTTEAEVRKVIAAGIQDVYIDISRGDDVSDAPTAVEVRAELDRAMMAAAQAAIPRVSLAEESARARKVHREASTIIRNLMRDVRLGNQVRVEQVEPVVERMTGSILRNSGAMLSLCRVKTKDAYTFLHSVSVGALLIAFCRDLGMDAETIRQAGIGGMLHDVGKVRVPDAILNKPGRLTDKEFARMQDHVVESRRILERTPDISPTVLQVAAQHHERYDGKGYAQGLKGDAISRIGQMAAICDVYDAITSDRAYHKGMAPTDALRKIFEWSEFHFNPQLAQAFLRCIGIYPVGTLVMLESGRLALVVDQHEGKLLQPLVRVIFSSRSNRYLPPEDVDLARPGAAERIVGHEVPAKWGIDPARFL